MEKKEFKVGEVFTAGLLRLKCMEATAPDSGCGGCIFNNFSCEAIDIVSGPCNCAGREDGKNVIFVKAD